MRNESGLENSANGELSPSELLLQVSKKVEAIFDDATKRPNLYTDVNTVTSETGTEVSYLCASRSGAGLKRSRDKNTGTTGYELSEIYYHDLSKQVFVYCWSTLGPAVSFSVNSEVWGDSEPELKTGKENIRLLQKMIEGHFPEPDLEVTKQTLAQRVLAFLRQ
jgi:hypothetical protein